MHDEITEHMNKNVSDFSLRTSHVLIARKVYRRQPFFDLRRRLFRLPSPSRYDCAIHYSLFQPRQPNYQNQLLVTSGVGQAIELSGFCLLDKDDGVLLARPHYGNFPIDLGYRVG